MNDKMRIDKVKTDMAKGDRLIREEVLIVGVEDAYQGKAESGIADGPEAENFGPKSVVFVASIVLVSFVARGSMR